jgi:CubicO group peptidase (beta-lactamase class C family)
MFDLKAVSLVGCIVLSSMFGHAMANQGALAEPSAREAFLRSTEGIIDAYREADWFTGTVAIFDGDALIFDQSYGLADISQNIANESNTRIRIGSINKHFTAALVLRLVQRGELGIDDTLARFDLGFPDAIANQVSLRHLLSHRSGFEDIFTEEYRKTYKSLESISDKLPLLLDAPLRFEPGSDRHYSNYGYIVLGAVVERVTGKAFGVALEDEILEPAGLNDTFYALTADVPGKARSYRFTYAGNKQDRTGDLENVTPDGGMYSTPADLIEFFSKLFYSDAIINDEMKALMANGYSDRDISWGEVLESPTAVWSSYGGGPGVSAALELLLKDRLFIVVLANTDALVAEQISQRVVALYRGEEPEPAQLPVSVFAYQYLAEHGAETFSSQFEEALGSAGYADFSDAWLNRLGFELYGRGETERALLVLKKNAELFPQEENTFDSIAYVYEKIGDEAAAIANYRKALAINPEFTSSLEGLARLGKQP